MECVSPLGGSASSRPNRSLSSPNRGGRKEEQLIHNKGLKPLVRQNLQPAVGITGLETGEDGRKRERKGGDGRALNIVGLLLLGLYRLKQPLRSRLCFSSPSNIFSPVRDPKVPEAVRSQPVDCHEPEETGIQAIRMFSDRFGKKNSKGSGLSEISSVGEIRNEFTFSRLQG